MVSWCSVWHPIHGSLSWLPAYPGASYAETSLPENTVGLLVFIMPTDVHCDFTYANFPLSPPSLRWVLPSRSPGVQVGLCLYQIAIQIFSSFPATKELQPLHTPLLVRIPEQEHFNVSHCTSESARWNCSWKGIWWPCPKQYKDFGFYCWRGKTTNFFILVLEHSPVVLSRLWSLCLNSTHEYTCVCVCVCMHMYKNIWRVSSFQKIWAHVCLYILGLNLALRYCVYLAAVFYMKLVWRKQKIIWSPPVKIFVIDDVNLHTVLFRGEILFF